ncbi:hypothetical protein RJZ90_004605 [Blastomyces dermatitidis]
MPKRHRSQVTSSKDSDTTDKLSCLDMNSQRKDKHKHRQLAYKLNTPVSKKHAAATATDDSENDTDPEDDTDDEISSGDEDDDYSPGARALIGRMENHWQRKKEAEPSADPKWRDPIDAVRAAGQHNLYQFFNWHFRLKLGKRDHQLKGMNKLSTLNDNWKFFLRYYESATGIKVDRQLMRLMQKISPNFPSDAPIDEADHCGRAFDSWPRSTGWTRRRRRRPQCM